MAPTGWPFAFSPPERFTGTSPPHLVSPSRAAVIPSPGSYRPSDSRASTSAIVKQSWTSATSTSSGPTPASSYASSAALSAASVRAYVSRSWSAARSPPWPLPVIATAASRSCSSA